MSGDLEGEGVGSGCDGGWDLEGDLVDSGGEFGGCFGREDGKGGVAKTGLEGVGGEAEAGGEEGELFAGGAGEAGCVKYARSGGEDGEVVGVGDENALPIEAKVDERLDRGLEGGLGGVGVDDVGAVCFSEAGEFKGGPV